MSYTVTYTTNTIPTELPEGAQVRVVPTTFPAEVKTKANRRFKIIKDSIWAAHLTLGATSGPGNTAYAGLDADEARELAHLLLEAIGDDVPGAPKAVYREGDAEPPDSVRKLRDKDGDVWYRNGNGWSTAPDDYSTDRWSYIQRYAPLTVIEA